MGVANLRPTRDIDARQFVSRREFNALLREVQRLSRFNVQTPGRYYDMPGGRTIQTISARPGKRWKLTYDDVALVWTLKFKFLTSREGIASLPLKLIEDTYKWNNTMTTAGQFNNVVLIYDTTRTVPGFDNPDWVIDSKSGGTNDVTGADATTLTAENSVINTLTHEFDQRLITIRLNQEGTFELGYQATTQFEVEQSIDFDVASPEPPKARFTYRQDTRTLTYGPFAVTSRNGLGEVSTSQSVILPAGPVVNEGIFMHSLITANDLFVSAFLEVAGVFQGLAPGFILITKRRIGIIDTDANDNLISIRLTGDTYIDPFGIDTEFDVITSVDFGAETVTTKTLRFGTGDLIQE